MSALPLFKIGMLAVRTVSKPIATSIKSSAKRHPTFSRVCAFTGQTWHVIVSRVNIRLLGHKITKVKPLGEADAISRGADFFGEFFIYSVSVAAVVLEVWRNDRAKIAQAEAKEARRRKKDEFFEARMKQVDSRIEEVRAQTMEMRDLLEQLREKQEREARTWWPWM